MATVAQLRQAAGNAGFTGVPLTIAVAIALAESGGNENASHRNTDGSTDLGAWQINSVHKELLAGKNPYDLQQNAAMAFALYQSKQGSFSDWTTAHTVAGKPPAYKAFLRQAQGGGAQGIKQHHDTVAGSSTLGDLVGSSGQNIGDTAAVLNPVHNLDTFLAAISDSALWKRVGLGFLAFLLLLVGFIIMIESNKTVRKTTVDAAKVAAL